MGLILPSSLAVTLSAIALFIGLVAASVKAYMALLV